MNNKSNLIVHPVILGKVLILCRHKFNFSQKDLGKLLGVTSQAVSKWELGISAPDLNYFMNAKWNFLYWNW